MYFNDFYFSHRINYKQFSADIKCTIVRRRHEQENLVWILWLYTFIITEYNTMIDIVFSYGWEPVLIHRFRMNTRKSIKFNFLFYFRPLPFPVHMKASDSEGSDKSSSLYSNIQSSTGMFGLNLKICFHSSFISFLLFRDGHSS